MAKREMAGWSCIGYITVTSSRCRRLMTVSGDPRIGDDYKGVLEMSSAALMKLTAADKAISIRQVEGVGRCPSSFLQTKQSIGEMKG